ncbi:MAG: TolC family protein [Candidatus Omnitrophota bacterium]
MKLTKLFLFSFLFIFLSLFLAPLVFPSTDTPMDPGELKRFSNGERLSLTVEKCIEIGLLYSKTYYASQMDVDIATAKFKEARTKQLPSLKLDGSYTRMSKIPPFEVVVEFPGVPPMHFVLSQSILNYYNFQFSLQQPLFTGFAIENSIKAAKMGVMAAQELHTRDRNELIYNIKNAYWTLYKAIEFQKLIDENVGMIQSHLNDVQRFFDQGLAKLNDVMKVQVQLSSMKVNQLDMTQKVRLATMALNSLLGIPLDQQIALTSPINVIPETRPEVSAQVSQALTQRSEIKAMGYNIRALEASKKIAQAGYYPRLFLVANYYYSNPNTRIMPIQSKFNDTWDLSLGLSLDLWNWRSTAFQVNQAGSQLLKARAGESQLKDMITLEVQQNYFDLMQAKEKINLSETSVKQAEENYRITNERFKAGLTTNSELLDAEVALLNTKVSRTEAFIDVELARARLDKSTGKDE